MKIKIAAGLGLLLLMSACASDAPNSPPPSAPPPRYEPPPPPADQCGAAEAQKYVGRPRTEIPIPVLPALQRVACTTAQTVVDTLVQENLIERAAVLGTKLLSGFQRELAGCEQVAAVRGKGLMIGIELKKDCPNLVADASAQGLLINVTAGKVIRLLPPLVLSDADAELLVSSLCKLIRQTA